MDILIPDEWLREFLNSKATPKQIEKYLSLCGPSVEKVEKNKKDHIYHIEITTNRMDSAGVLGIAREASAILPRFKIAAKLKQSRKTSKYKYAPKVNYLYAKVNSKLCPRFTCVLIKGVSLKDSPLWMKKRLENVGVRPINNVIDISNYIMHELGQPVHTFDYDKIESKKMVLRKARKNEKITTLDNKTHTLPGGDIVIEDGSKKLIDLAGIMGGSLSAVDKTTKNVLLFVQTYNPVSIRKTAMKLGARSEASSLFEKRIDTELVTQAIKRGIELFEKLTKGKAEKNILDIYPSPYKSKTVNVKKELIEKRLGISLSKKEISNYLKPLEFIPKWKRDVLFVNVPSFREKDINIPEDIVEEVARIYGFHNLPSKLMIGALPQKLENSPFKFERNIKQILKGYGATETYNTSLVPEELTNKNSLKLKNPLGKAKYLRNTLLHSLVASAKTNKREKVPYHIFEMANVYIPRRKKLPKEVMTLSGIFSKYPYRRAKGVVESLLSELNISYESETSDLFNFEASKRLIISHKKKVLGQLGILESGGYFYYSFEVELLRKHSKQKTFKILPKYPSQIEDLTLTFPDKTKIGEVVKYIKSIDKLVNKIELTTIYKNSYTFRIWYQDKRKNLTDREVEKIRKKVISKIKVKFGGRVKN